MDGESLDFPEASFDYAVLCHVLSVTANPSQMLAEIHRVLRPAGRLFVLNHVTPEGAWRFIDTLLAPFARQLCFRSRFRVTDLSGIERFRSMRHLGSGLFGLMKAYAFEK
jgi:phosphatidylethanolamine/phosphatidyl-N-methylethanolamine N-methyltransferase